MQLHWVDAATGEIHRSKLSRAEFVEFFASLLSAKIAMEAWGGSHHGARTLRRFGHEVELLPAGQVRPFVIGNKDDAADARAIWHAATHGDVRRVPIESIEQQAVLSLHRTRAQWVSVRTATINSMRGLLYEFGVVLPKGRCIGIGEITQRRAAIDGMLPPTMIRLLDEQLRTVREIERNVKAMDREIAITRKTSEAAKGLYKVPGIGPLGASALAAVLGDHTHMCKISKRGDPYVRTLLVCGARAVASSGPNAPDWVRQLMLRRPANVVFVALANKLARTAWALIAQAREYEKNWKSTPPTKAPMSSELAIAG
jgi:transposase